jgi:hypothetical protein
MMATSDREEPTMIVKEMTRMPKAMMRVLFLMDAISI